MEEFADFSTFSSVVDAGLISRVPLYFKYCTLTLLQVFSSLNTEREKEKREREGGGGDRQTDKKTDRQRQKQTDRQRQRRKDRQTEILPSIFICHLLSLLPITHFTTF